MRFAAIVSALWLCACGAHPSTGGTMYNGTFAIQGAPHGGRYNSCTVPMKSGNVYGISCIGLPSCPACTVEFTIPVGPGTYKCSEGSAAVQVVDGTAPDGASCLAADNDIGGAHPSCPNAAPGNCNQVLGECNISVASLSPVDVSDPWGHFSGSISATLYSGDMTDMNGCIVPTGSPTAVTIDGAW
jgi:hypothetical protein